MLGFGIRESSFVICKMAYRVGLFVLWKHIFLLLFSPLPYFSISVLQKVFSEAEAHRMHFSSLPMLVFKRLETSEQIKRNVLLSFSSPRPVIVACDTFPALSNLGNKTCSGS